MILFLADITSQLPHSMADLNWMQLGIGGLVGALAGFILSYCMSFVGGSSQPLPAQQPLPQESDSNSRRWEQLPDLLGSLTSAEESGKLYNAIVQLSCKQLESEYSALLMRHGDEYVYEAGEGFCEESKQAFKLGIKEGLIAYMQTKNCPIRLAKGDRQLSIFRFLREPISEVLLVPMRTGSSIFALLFLANKANFGTFTNADFSLVSYLALPFSLAIHNAAQFKGFQTSAVGTVTEIVNQYEAGSPYTDGHSARVAKLAEATGKEMRMSPQELESLRIAAQVHDLGKLALPQELRFSEETPKGRERELYINQTKRAVTLLKPLGFVDKALPIILGHHERFDGSGFPNGLRGPAIPIGAMIIAIAETYDLITHPQPNRPKSTVDEAVRYLSSLSNTKFDPQILRAFLQVIEKLKIAAAEANKPQ